MSRGNRGPDHIDELVEVAKFSKPELSSMVVTDHVWLLKLKEQIQFFS